MTKIINSNSKKVFLTIKNVSKTEPCSKAQKHLMGVRISFKVNNKGTRKTSTGAVSYLVLTVIYQTRLKLMHETNKT